MQEWKSRRQGNSMQQNVKDIVREIIATDCRKGQGI
jgi:hypothetical protein